MAWQNSAFWILSNSTEQAIHSANWRPCRSKGVYLPAMKSRQLRQSIKWLSGERRFAFNTSGSTGTPKKVHFTREQIAASAQRSIEFFELQPGDTILCCLNTQFVAGFMMLIRGIIGGLKLIIVDPVANPLKHIHEQSIAFVAPHSHTGAGGPE
jgi:O-succinylbenzoic acid--CoA ligase